MSEDRILDFLDGRLTSGDEEELLHTLAVSPERRQLLREHLRIREITNTMSKHQSFNVPAHVTSNLFATLGTMGYAAPATTEAILTRAPQLVRSSQALSTAQRAIVATKSAWRLGFSSLAAASAMSFLLGAGSLYMFGPNLGIGSASHQDVITAVSAKGTVANAATTQYSSVVAKQIVAQPVARLANINYAGIGFPDYPNRDGNGPVSNVEDQRTSTETTDPAMLRHLTYNTPREYEITAANRIPREMQPNDIPDWFAAIPSPLQNEQGVISIRYGTGDASNFKSVLPSNSPTVPSASLMEAKMTWHLWKYVTAHACMGMLSSYEQMPNKTPISTGKNQWAVTTSLTAVPNTLITGGELGFTLDPLGIPLETSAGLMFDGTGRAYFRGGLFFHFEPFDAVSFSGGIEGITYRHDVAKTLGEMSTVYQDYGGNLPLAPGTPSSEWVGFIGPSIEFGYRF